VERHHRLDLGNGSIRKKDLAVTVNSQFDQTFDAKAVITMGRREMVPAGDSKEKGLKENP